jgi:YD repeat-containing protein
LGTAVTSASGTHASVGYTPTPLRLRQSQTREDNTTDSYGYDPQGQITGQSLGNGYHPGLATGVPYDPMGNRLTTSTFSGDGATYVPPCTNTYSSLNGNAWLTDMNGNVQQTRTSTFRQDIAWNVSDRVAQVQDRVWTTGTTGSGGAATAWTVSGPLVTYKYDAFGRRISRRTTQSGSTDQETHFFYDGWNLVAETSEDNDTLRR